MTQTDAMHFIHNYRHKPRPEDAPHFFSFLAKERLLWNRSTAVPFAGAVIGLCDRHAIMLYDSWRVDHKTVLHQAISISKSKARLDPLWAEFLLMRWFILGSDKPAWELLCLAHHGNKMQKIAAQTAINKVTYFMGQAPNINANGVMQGKVDFEDMRLQMLRLANEFRSFKPSERQLAFELLPFSRESQQAQLFQSAGLEGLLVGQPVESLLVH